MSHKEFLIHAPTDSPTRPVPPRGQYRAKEEARAAYLAGQRTVRNVGLSAVTVASLLLAAAVGYAILH